MSPPPKLFKSPMMKFDMNDFRDDDSDEGMDFDQFSDEDEEDWDSDQELMNLPVL